MGARAPVHRLRDGAPQPNCWRRQPPRPRPHRGHASCPPAVPDGAPPRPPLTAPPDPNWGQPWGRTPPRLPPERNGSEGAAAGRACPPTGGCGTLVSTIRSSMAVFDRILRSGEGRKLKALAGLVPDINAL